MSSNGHIEIKTDHPALEIHQETEQEKEFIDAGGDAPAVPAPLKPARKKGVCPVDKMSENQIQDACDRIVMGSTVSEVAKELNVSPMALSRKVKERMGILYMRRWQQSINFDALRAEKILHSAMERIDESPKWGKLALEVLSYRSRVLGFENQTVGETSIRVAGMSQSEIFAEIKKKL